MDEHFTRQVLDALNAGTLRVPSLDWKEFPEAGRDILDLRTPVTVELHRESAAARLSDLLPGLALGFLPGHGENVTLQERDLEDIGLALAPFTAFGILNGGMATSYADVKKNRAFGPELYEAWKPALEATSAAIAGLPKGLTPAFIQPDGTPGPNYLALKLRHLQLINLAVRKAGYPGPGLQLFQMTSDATDAAIRSAWPRLAAEPELSDLADLFPTPPTETPTRVQDLVGTFTPAGEGTPRRLFTVPGKTGPEPYALPGGHGQNFRVLKQLYGQLETQGYRFVYLGNVDNLGYLPSLRSLALLALTGAPAAFDFAYKTPLDTKGGVLYRQASGRLNCADIGVAIEVQKVREAEAAGRPILFNCATGLFDLKVLNHNIDAIIDGLPLRVSEQDKDVGRYAQVEQVTWEVIGLLQDPLIFGIEKKRRFLAAKLLMDCFLTSGFLARAGLPASESLRPFREQAAVLEEGLQGLLNRPLGFARHGGTWKPLSRAQLEEKIEKDWRFLSV